MPFNDYRCPHGHITTIQRAEDAIMCGSDCSEIARRRWSFNVARSIPEHFNNALGQWVNNENDVRDGLKRAAERQAREVGYDTTYDYIEPADMKAAGGVTDEGLDVTHKKVHDAGLVLKDGNYVPR